MTLEGNAVVEAGKRLAILRDGAVQMMPGKKDRRDEVLRFIGSLDAPASIPSPSVSPPAGDPSMGDKDPDVVAWWFRHDPDAARSRYEKRRFPTRSLYFPD